MRFSSLIFLFILSILSFVYFTIYFYFIDYREISKISNHKLILNPRKFSSLKIGDSPDNHFWIVQITDLHLSKFDDQDRAADLLKLCSKHIRAIRPSIVLVTGDIADSKSKSALHSKQHLEEWQAYKSVLENSNVLNHTVWLDIRGNHDSFNVPNLYHANNLFRQYSVQGQKHLQSYKYVHKTSYGSYSFVGIDACPNPGLKRPYNFFGILSTATAQVLQQFTRDIAKDNMTIWFGHYPTSTIISPGIDLKSLIGQSSTAYFCGHLHTLGNRISKMYSLQPEGFLELELGDWRDSRLVRVAVFDHDIFSFVDFKMDDWPVIVVTNPKDSSFLMPHREASSKIAESTHIRVFVWSFELSFEVKVFIDDIFIGIASRVTKNEPLHALRWSPSKYSNESHWMRIDVQEDSGNIKSVKHKFNIEGNPEWDFHKWPSVVLLSDQSLNIRIFYYTLWNTVLLFLVICKYLSWKSSKLFCYQDNPWIVASLRFAANSHLFYPLIIYLLYSVSCPIIITELVDGHWGLVFVHGVYVSKTYIPEASPYLSELSQNGTFIIPLIFILIRNIRYDDIYISSRLKYFSRQWLFIMIVMWQCALITYWTLIPYGVLGTLLSPCRLHVLTLSFYLMIFVRRTKKLATHLYDVELDLSQSNDNNSANNSTKCNMFLHPDESYANLSINQ